MKQKDYYLAYVPGERGTCEDFTRIRHGAASMLNHGIYVHVVVHAISSAAGEGVFPCVAVPTLSQTQVKPSFCMADVGGITCIQCCQIREISLLLRTSLLEGNPHVFTQCRRCRRSTQQDQGGQLLYLQHDERVRQRGWGRRTRWRLTWWIQTR